MRIDHYSFGRIVVDGHTYDTDVIIFSDHVQARWWRREGHRLEREDLASVMVDPPRMLVIGTGYFGRMKVPEETLAFLRGLGVEVRVAKTGDAVRELNRLQKESARIVAALHLTC
jgi:hypothetical protein